jgi:hypothetical protein
MTRSVPTNTRAVAALVALAVVAVMTGCGGGTHGQTALSITVEHYVFAKDAQPKEVTEHFSLGCRPVSGTLPFAARVCVDIARHRQAMLAPREQRSACGGSPFMPMLSISVKRGWSGGGISGSPWCGWPGGTPIEIYYAASVRDAKGLRRAEPLLRCEDDPLLFATPTPWASVAACTHGLWTRAAEQAIRVAATAPAIAGLNPGMLFPRDPGAKRCRIPAGGPSPGRTFAGLCEVKLTGAPSAKAVHFAETWSVARRRFTHSWVIRGRTLLTQSGSPPPQMWS